MRQTRLTNAWLGVALIVVPLSAAAQVAGITPAPPAPARSGPASPQPPATHTTRGVVRSIDATKLVIGDRRGTVLRAFVLTASTERQGHVAAGASVAVRYRREKGANIATAITVEPTQAEEPAPGSRVPRS